MSNYVLGEKRATQAGNKTQAIKPTGNSVTDRTIQACQQ